MVTSKLIQDSYKKLSKFCKENCIPIVEAQELYNLFIEKLKKISDSTFPIDDLLSDSEIYSEMLTQTKEYLLELKSYSESYNYDFEFIFIIFKGILKGIYSCQDQSLLENKIPKGVNGSRITLKLTTEVLTNLSAKRKILRKINLNIN